jgi:hypothetical protein
MTDDYAIIVGIDDYPGLSKPLRGAIADARAMRDWAISPTGGAVPAANVTLIESTLTHDQPPDGLPGQKEITRAFGALLRLPVDGQGRLGRRLYIFFAGHGFARRSDEACVITADARENSLEHAAAHSYLRIMRETGRFDQICLFSDCCREQFNSVPGSEPALVFNQRPRPCDTVAAFAADWSNLTSERIVGDQIRGVFSTALLKALGMGRIDLDALRAYTLEAARTLTGGVPPIKFHTDAPTPTAFLFNEAASTSRVAVALHFAPASQHQQVRIEDGRNNVLWQGTADGSPATVPLEPGTYVASVAGRMVLFDVKPGASQDVRL